MHAVHCDKRMQAGPSCTCARLLPFLGPAGPDQDRELHGVNAVQLLYCMDAMALAILDWAGLYMPTHPPVQYQNVGKQLLHMLQ